MLLINLYFWVKRESLRQAKFLFLGNNTIEVGFKPWGWESSTLTATSTRFCLHITPDKISSFWRNCGAASVGEWNRKIWFSETCWWRSNYHCEPFGKLTFRALALHQSGGLTLDKTKFSCNPRNVVWQAMCHYSSCLRLLQLHLNNNYYSSVFDRCIKTSFVVQTGSLPFHEVQTKYNNYLLQDITWKAKIHVHWVFMLFLCVTCITWEIGLKCWEVASVLISWVIHVAALYKRLFFLFKSTFDGTLYIDLFEIQWMSGVGGVQNLPRISLTPQKILSSWVGFDSKTWNILF